MFSYLKPYKNIILITVLVFSVQLIKADIYLNIFEGKIINRNITICIDQTCNEFIYSDLIRREGLKDSSHQILNEFLIQNNQSLESFLEVLHKSHYPERYSFKLEAEDVNLPSKKIDLTFQGNVFTFDENDISENIFTFNEKVFINPFYIFERINGSQKSFIDPEAKQSQIFYTPNYISLLKKINNFLNSSNPYLKVFPEKEISIPHLKSFDSGYILRNISKTSFYGSNPNRVFNIKHAISKLPILEIEPNETVSFLEKLGDITFETGYKESLVITSKGFDPQAGGGVCQYSTANYLAALKAGLSIKERSNHSKAISYYAQANDYGLDSSVYPGIKDLKIQNPFSFPVIIYNIYHDFNIYSFTFSPQNLPQVELVLNSKVINHLEDKESILGEYNDLIEPVEIQSYIPNIKTHWIRFINGEKEDIFSNYLPQKRILDYSNN